MMMMMVLILYIYWIHHSIQWSCKKSRFRILCTSLSPSQQQHTRHQRIHVNKCRCFHFHFYIPVQNLILCALLFLSLSPLHSLCGFSFPILWYFWRERENGEELVLRFSFRSLSRASSFNKQHFSIHPSIFQYIILPLFTCFFFVFRLYKV